MMTEWHNWPPVTDKNNMLSTVYLRRTDNLNVAFSRNLMKNTIKVSSVTLCESFLPFSSSTNNPDWLYFYLDEKSVLLICISPPLTVTLVLWAGQVLNSQFIDLTDLYGPELIGLVKGFLLNSFFLRLVQGPYKSFSACFLSRGCKLIDQHLKFSSLTRKTNLSLLPIKHLGYQSESFRSQQKVQYVPMILYNTVQYLHSTCTVVD